MSWILKPCGSPCISPTDLCAAAAGKRTLKMKMPRLHAADMIIKIKPRSVREKSLTSKLWATSSSWTLMDYRLKTTRFSLKVSLPSGVLSLQSADSSQSLQKLPFPRLSLSSCSSLCTVWELNTKSDSPPMFPQTHQGHKPLIQWFLSLWTWGRNTAAGRFVCGRCKTAQVIFNCLPVIVSLLGTCIVLSFFRNPTHLALRQVKTNTDANIWPEFAPSSFYTIAPPFSYVLHRNHCPTDGSDFVFGFCSVIKKLWRENNIRSDSQLVWLSPEESQSV